MSKKLTERYLRKLYSRLLGFAKLSFRMGSIYCANRFLMASSYLAYTFYLKYHDDVAEDLVANIAQKIKKRCQYNITQDKYRCVFLDSSAVFNGGLTIQYMRAIHDAGWNVLYVTGHNMESDSQKDLRKIIASNKKAEIVSVPYKLKGVRWLQYLYDIIVDYQPTNIFLHVSPFAPAYVEVCNALPKKITKFWINYTDHSFFLGSECADYSIEMRNRGCSISHKWRNIDMSRQMLLPFYPNMLDEKFLGLPEACKGRKIVFSGGNYWKVMNEEETYFKICKKILDANPDTIIVYAGIGEVKPVKKMLEKYGIQSRFLLIGWRKDLSALFNKCDVYLSTYPAFGGLMSVYAALKAKPILAYAREEDVNKVESIVCQFSNYTISHNNINDLVAESVHLLTDSNYNKSVGFKIQKCTITKQWFDNTFKEIVDKKCNGELDIVIDEQVRIVQDEINDTIVYHEKSGVWKKSIASFLGLLSIFAGPSFVPGGIKTRVMNFIKIVRTYYD